MSTPDSLIPRPGSHVGSRLIRPEDLTETERLLLLRFAGARAQQAQEQGISEAEALLRQRTQAQPDTRQLSIGGDIGDAIVSGIGNVVQFLEESPASRKVRQFGRRLRILEQPEDSTIEQELGLDATMLAGIFDSALIDPAVSIAQLAEASFLPALASPEDSPKVSDWLRRQGEGAFNAAERYALGAGVSESEITDAYEVGNFIGVTAPIVGSVKGAMLLTGTSVKLMKWPWAGDLITDSTAGAIYGGLLVPEPELGKRWENAAKESALFGVGRIALTLGLPFRTMRQKRAFRKSITRESKATLEAMERGEQIPVIRTQDEALSIGSLLNEEQWLSTSREAQVVLAENADERALVEAILDVSGHGGSGGVLRWAASDFKTASQMSDRFRREFPGLKFDVVKGQRERTFDVFFGTKGLSNRQRSQLAREGRFEGLDVEYGDAIYEYVGRSSRQGRVRIRDKVEGKVKHVKEENISDRLTFTEKIDRTPELDALYRDFSRFYDEGAMQTLAARGGFADEGQLIQAIQRGEVSISPANRRAFDQGGAIVHPEELGPEIAQRISTATPAVPSARGQLEPVDWFTFDDVFDRWALNRELPRNSADYVASRSHFATRKRNELWDAVPESDKTVYRQVLEEQDRLIDEFGISFDHFAGGKGFSVQSLPGGQALLRDVNSGAPFAFGSEARARDWLKTIVRPERDLPDIIPQMNHGVQAGTNGFNPAYDVWTFDPNIRSLETQKQLPLISRQFRNTMDLFQRIEETTGLPIWSQGFLPIDRGIQRMRQQMLPWEERIGQIWRGISVQRRNAITDVWTEIEGSDLTLSQAANLFRDRGFSPREVSAFTQSRRLFDQLFEASGIDPNRYMKLYLSRLRPSVQNYRGDDLEVIFSGAEAKPTETQFWAELTRTGQLAQFEKDPEIIMHKYVRSLLWRDNVKPAYDRLSQLVGQRGGDGAIRAITFRDIKEMWGESASNALMAKAMPGTRLSDPVLPQPLRGFIEQFLISSRGLPDKGWETVRAYTARVLDKLNVRADPRVVEELLNTYQSTMYAAALGLRPGVTARNFTQNLWLLYSRIGNKHIGPGLERAMTEAGFQEALDVGVLRLTEAGVPFQDALMRQIAGDGVTGGTGAGRVIAPVMQLMMRFGRVSRALSQQSLKFYSASDQINRSWAYFAQKGHTAEHLLKYEQGKIGWDKFVEDGLPFFRQPSKDHFRQLYDTEGKESALRFIGFQASDEANFIYGIGSTPPWMQKPWGRFVGMFGQWPLWAAETYFSRSRLGTPKQKAAFWTRTAALAGIFTNIGIQTGVNMWNWMAPLSIFNYGLGPAADYAVNLHSLQNAPIEQKPASLARLAQNMGRLVIPGQVAWNDITDALSAADPEQAAFRAILGRQTDESDWMASMNFDPRVEEANIRNHYKLQMRPDTEQAMRFRVIVPPGLPSPRQELDNAEFTTRITQPPDVDLEELSRRIFNP